MGDIIETDRLRPDAAAATDPALAAVVEELGRIVGENTRELARLRSALDQALRLLDEQPGKANPGARVARAKRATINWVIGPPDNAGWAYGNNAARLSALMPDYHHVVSGREPADLAIYFDAIVADRFRVDAKKSILRIGGPRPLDRLFGDDEKAMARAFERFDAVVALNGELFFRAMRVHPNVHLIPNALNLDAWSPRQRQRAEGQPFTVGFAASLKSSAEAETKGHPIVTAAARRIGAALLQTSKGGSQIAHDRMIEDFYSKIDVLVQPVGPGREGTSNVIMEALALGVPVVTTVHAGYHGEYLVDGKTALIRNRDELEMAEAIALLQRDDKLRRKIGAAGRAFAERHHDLRQVARGYEALIAAALAPPAKPRSAKRRKIAFVPFWQPAEEFGSSRLRALYPARFLGSTARFDVTLGYAEDADVVIVVQMCEDALLDTLRARPDQFVIYDVCDKYYENPREFKHVTPPIRSDQRFAELCDRADLVIVPSRELKAEVASRLPDKPVRFVPEPADYGAMRRPPQPPEPRVVLWYGNPDRGNFESARWMIERLRDEHGYEPLIVSRKSFFRKHPDYLPFVVDWSMEAMQQAFGKASLCVVAYHPDEQAKSPNRYVAATMQGVPTLACNSPAVADLLAESELNFGMVQTPAQLDRAIAKLHRPEFRTLFIKRAQRFLDAKFGERPTARTYVDLLEQQSFAPAIFAERRRIAFVTHNLAVGEGAPWSLFELVKGLRDKGVDPYVFSACAGPLAQQYIKAGIPLEIFDDHARHMVKVLNTRLDGATKSFGDFLERHRIEAVVCNTVKSSAFVKMADDRGVPGAVIIRESYAADERFTHFQGDARLQTMLGLSRATHAVFVAETSRAAWHDQPFRSHVRVIPNGISIDRFAGDDGAPPPERMAARAALGLPTDAVIAICVGTINNRKGQRELLEAFAELEPAVRDRAAIVFLGAVENSQLGEFNRALQEAGEDVRARIHVIPATDDVSGYLAAADLFLMNSSSEAYPRSVVEALLFGLPVISTKVYGVNEQVRHGQSAFLYDFNDMAAWREHFSQLVCDDTLRQRMAAAARRSFWMLTGYEEMLLSYKAVIGDMLASRA